MCVCVNLCLSSNNLWLVSLAHCNATPFEMSHLVCSVAADGGIDSMETDELASDRVKPPVTTAAGSKSSESLQACLVELLGASELLCSSEASLAISFWGLTVHLKAPESQWIYLLVSFGDNIQENLNTAGTPCASGCTCFNEIL